jgi:phosphohistidine phosphatase
MKLFLMRHAEAVATRDCDDIFRELTTKGIKEAEEAAQFLQNCHINKILVSNAKRTMQTAEIIQSKIKCTNFEIAPELYASTSKKMIKIISKQEDIDKNILVIAHNPGIFNAALTFIDHDSLEYDALIEGGMPTAKIVTLDFPKLSHWSDISAYTRSVS